MKRFIKNILSFIPFFITGYIVFLCFAVQFLPQTFQPNVHYRLGSYGKLFSRTAELKTKGQIDILFVGSSHTYRSFDTRIFEKAGFKTFNLGSSRQTPLQTEVLLERYLERLNPKLVVYDVYPKVIQNDGVESSFDVLANDKFDLQSIMMAIKINDLQTYNVLIYTAYRQLLGLDKNFTEPVKTLKDTYISGGFVERELEYYTGKIKNLPDTIRFLPKQLRALDNILNRLKSKKIPYILIQTPVTKDLYKSVINRDEIDQFMARKGKYYNFNDKVNLIDTIHFYDKDHMNQKGVNVFDAYFIDLLKTHFLLN